MGCIRHGKEIVARFFAEEIGANMASIIEDAPHMAKTLRMKPGDTFIAMDGLGGDFVCRAIKVSPKKVEAEVLERKENTSEPDVSITVYQGVCRAHRFEYVVQKCTEIGVQKIVPLLLQRCETKEYSPSKTERFHKIAREAAKQSGRGIVPEITQNMALSVPLAARHDLLLCPYELETESGLKDALRAGNYRDIGIVIGPEGGIEPEEAGSIQRAGGKTVTLGKRILRTETAAPVVSAIILYELDEMNR